MELTLVPGRPPLILAAALGVVLAFAPLGALAAGVAPNDLLETCRAIMGGFTGAMPCAVGR